MLEDRKPLSATMSKWQRTRNFITIVRRRRSSFSPPTLALVQEMI